MSKSQRRDHRPVLKSKTLGRPYLCGVCGEGIHEIYNRTLKVSNRHYWRHMKR